MAALALLLAMIVLVTIHPELRALARATWREMRTLSLATLALVAALKFGQALFSALSWHNVLRAAWPNSELSFRFVLGVDQGQDALNSLTPARAGTWTMLGVFGLSIPRATAPKLLAVWAVQNLAFFIFAIINYTLIGIGLPDRSREGESSVTRIASLITDHPLPATLIAMLVIALVVIVIFFGRRRIDEWRAQVREGLAILGTPGRYLRLLFLPALLSYLFRCGAYMVLLAAFDIPVTIWTVALAVGSHALAGAIRFTPGGIGATQAIDVIALRDYAATEVVTAYSLSEIAISAVVSFILAIGALLSVNGWRGVRALSRGRQPG